MKVLFCGGGTSGHISPAIAIAEYLLEKENKCDIRFVGRLNGFENSAVKKAGYKLYELDICGFERKISPKNVRNFFKLLISLKKSKKIISEFRPDIVIGTGGYVTWPVVKTAAKNGIPTLIHETNAYPGLVTRTLSKKVDKVLLNIPEAAVHLSDKCHIKIVGNPVKKDFYTKSRLSARRETGIKNDEFLIVSFGGSGGAEKLNKVIIEFVTQYSSKKTNVKHIHACGKKYYKNCKDILNSYQTPLHGITLCEYIENMPVLLKAADLVIARSGAMTLSELSAASAAAVLIPSPNVTNNHQYLNAKNLADKNAALLIEEKDLNVNILINTVESLRCNKRKQSELKNNISAVYRNNSTELIYREIKNTINLP